MKGKHPRCGVHLLAGAEMGICGPAHLIRQKEPRKLSAVDHLTRHSITLWEESFSGEATPQTDDVDRKERKKKRASTPFPCFLRERPRGKSSTKTEGNSAEQLMHCSVCLGQDLRDYATLVEEPGRRCCCLRLRRRHFAQLLRVPGLCRLALIEEQH